MTRISKLYLISCGLLFPLWIQAQQTVTLDELLDLALNNNLRKTLNQTETEKFQLETQAVAASPQTGFFVENEDFQPSNKDGVWKIGLEQEIPWPGSNKARKQEAAALLNQSLLNRELLDSEIKRELREAFYSLWYWVNKKSLYEELIKIHQEVQEVAQKRFKTGDIAGVDLIAAEVRYKETAVLINQVLKEIAVYQEQLMLLTQTQTRYLPPNESLIKLSLPFSTNIKDHPALKVQQQEIAVAQSAIGVEKSQNKPSLSARVFSQSYLGIHDPVSGFSVGIGFPLFGGQSRKNRLKVLEKEVELQQQELRLQEKSLEHQSHQVLAAIEKEEFMLDFYEETGLQQAEKIMSAARLSYRSGEINYGSLGDYMEQAISIKQNYLEALHAYNQAVIQLLYYSEGSAQP